jgi:hypothetical protein
MVSGFGFRVSGFGFRVSGFGLRISSLGFRVSGFGDRVMPKPAVWGLGFRDSDLGFRGWVCGWGSGLGVRALSAVGRHSECAVPQPARGVGVEGGPCHPNPKFAP